MKLSNFLREVIAPILTTEYLKNNLSDGLSVSKYYLINGIGSTSQEFITALETLTGRSDIQFMTMNNWSGIYSKNITVHHKRWCPACLNQFKQELGEIYEPLIWYIAALVLHK